MHVTYDNTNSGALFTNDDKMTDRHPDIKGTLNVEGVEYWCSGWNNTSKAGKDYISLKIEKKKPKPQTHTPQNSYDGPAPEDSIPF